MHMKRNREIVGIILEVKARRARPDDTSISTSLTSIMCSNDAVFLSLINEE